MNACVLLSLQQCMVQRGVGKHDQWGGYMTVLVVNHQIIKSISILIAVIDPMITFNVAKQCAYFHQEVKWTLPSC
jgi:hypothetical protein